MHGIQEPYKEDFLCSRNNMSVLITGFIVELVGQGVVLERSGPVHLSCSYSNSCDVPFGCTECPYNLNRKSGNSLLHVSP